MKNGLLPSRLFAVEWYLKARMKQVCVLALLALVPQVGLARDYSIGAAPAWVQRIAVEAGTAKPVAEISDGVFDLLNDKQVRIDDGELQGFYHFAVRAESDKGLDRVASITIGFDPAYQTLTLHTLNVIRKGQVISHLRTATVRVLQRETELEARIFDGRKTASIFLEDVRVGDVVEYAYSLKGSNPVFGGRHFGGMNIGWSVPVARNYGRLLVQNGRSIQLKYHLTKLQPVEKNAGKFHEYIWDIRNQAPIHVDSDVPGWYDPYPWVQWTEFGDWGSVAHWAEGLYRTPASMSPALQEVVDRLKQNVKPSERAIAALQFVQREIRYLGVEIGVGSHAPSSPELVLKRRFGDCKDKTLLTVTLLRALGIDAHPALVNTEIQRGILEQPPSPGVFNHVIVQARADDRVYWLDPTRELQTGTLNTISQPDFGQTLLVDAKTRDLTPMDTRAETRLRSRQIVAEFNARNGLDKPLVYTVTTRAEGEGAEILRSNLSSGTHDWMQKEFLNFYARYYPGIEIAAPFEVVDDARENRISVIEHYRIKDFWKHNDERKRLEATSYVPDMEDMLKQPHATLRSDPLLLQHPVDVTVNSVWLLPEEWTLTPDSENIDDPAFKFEHHLSLVDNKRKVVETDHFVSRADFVAGADAQRYAANLEKARQALGITLSMRDAVAGEPAQAANPPGIMERFNWSIAMLALTLTALLIWLAQRLYRYDPVPGAVTDPGIQGIGGWLLLPALGIFVQPLKILKDLVDLAPSYAADTWMQLTTAGQPSYHAMWAPTLLFELTANLGLLVFSVLLLILFVKKRSSLPYVFVAFQVGALLVTVTDNLVANLIPAVKQTSAISNWAVAIKQGISLAIWGSYFMMSQRVKSTFVHTLRARKATTTQPQIEQNLTGQE